MCEGEMEEHFRNKKELRGAAAYRSGGTGEEAAMVGSTQPWRASCAKLSSQFLFILDSSLSEEEWSSPQALYYRQVFWQLCREGHVVPVCDPEVTVVLT